MDAIVHFKPGAVTNLMKESRLLKTALLFSKAVYTNNPELTSLNAVYVLDDTFSVEHQYETILNAMPALNPESSVEHMRENLVQIKNLKKNNRKSSREIVALKKAQKQLGQINNTFRIITETLFNSSNFSKIVSHLDKKIFFEFDPLSTNTNSEYRYILDEDLLEGYVEITLKKLIQNKKEIEKYDILTLPLINEENFDQYSISSILKSQKIATIALDAFVSSLNDSLQKKDLDSINVGLEHFATVVKDLPLKKVSKKEKSKEAVSIYLGICTFQVLKKITKNSSSEIPPIPNPQGFVPFIFIKTTPINKPKATKQAMLQNK